MCRHEEAVRPVGLDEGCELITNELLVQPFFFRFDKTTNDYLKLHRINPVFLPLAYNVLITLD